MGQSQVFDQAHSFGKANVVDRAGVSGQASEVELAPAQAKTLGRGHELNQAGATDRALV